jgi:repressor LexA
LEISKAFGFKSCNSAEEILQRLAKHGAITLIPGIARGIRLVAA